MKTMDYLLKAVDEAIKQVLKEDGARVVYVFIENDCHLKREEIIDKPEVFSASLEKLLGSGALVIQILILKNLHRKLGLKFEEKKANEFSGCIKELRERCAIVYEK